MDKTIVRYEYKTFHFFIILILFSTSVSARPWDEHGYLRVSQNGHYLEYEDGEEFFWLGDTAWHLPSLDPDEVSTYMQDRASKRFNVIQITSDNFDLIHGDMPNYSGEHPFTGTPPHSSLNINEDYWQHIDYIVDEAAENDLYVVLFSAWGFGLNTNGWTDPYNLNFEYGQFLGNRYKDKKNVIFSATGELISIMGSYTALTDSTRVEWLRRLGQGIDISCNSKQLITIHGNPGNPGKKTMPSDFFKSDSWLDFYGNQCWQHPEYIDNQINGDYLLTNPVKPTINMESGYEDGFSAGSAVCSASGTPWGQRFMAYWSVFLGAFGHTYGHDRLASMSGPSNAPWDDRNKGILDLAALNDLGGNQMQYVRNLIESKPINSRVPDQSIIASSTGTDTGDSPNKIVATIDENNQWAFVYLTKGGSVTIDMTKINSTEVNAQWYNPRDGTYSSIGRYTNTGTRKFTALSSGEDNDWVLCLDAWK